MTTFLFVYGTLKRRSRHPMARRLASSARYVGEARLAGRLYDLGRFPGLKPPRSASDRVVGDVYDLGPEGETTLAELDAYENAESPPPTPYERLTERITLATGETIDVWIYWYTGEVLETSLILTGSYEGNCEPE